MLINCPWKFCFKFSLKFSWLRKNISSLDSKVYRVLAFKRFSLYLIPGFEEKDVDPSYHSLLELFTQRKIRSESRLWLVVRSFLSKLYIVLITVEMLFVCRVERNPFQKFVSNLHLDDNYTVFTSRLNALTLSALFSFWLYFWASCIAKTSAKRAGLRRT